MDPMDPMRWWFDWLQSAVRGAATGARRPSSTAGTPGASSPAPNPFANLFANPFANPFASALPATFPNPFELWQRWLEALSLLAFNPFTPSPFGANANAGGSMASAGPFDLAARWREMLAASATASATASAAPGHANATPLDPWAFFRQWFEVASAAWSHPLEEMLRSDAFAQASGAFLESASIAQRALRQAAEAQLAALGMPSREDVARVAGLVVQVETKVDRIEETLEDAQDGRAAELTARDDGVAALERRVERIEARLDRLLALVEGLDGRQWHARLDAPASAASAAPASASNGTGAPRAHKSSTTRSRRKPASAS